MITLLLVDDDIYTREGIYEMFTHEDIGIGRIEQADDGLCALELAERLKPDIILTDVRMPRMDGIELAFRVRELYPQCIIIIMSAYSDKEYLKSAIKVSAIQYVEKPIDEEELKEAIRTAVYLHREEKKRMEDEARTKQKLSASLPVVKNDVVLKLLRKSHTPETLLNNLNIAAPYLGVTCDYVTLIFQMTEYTGAYTGTDSVLQQEVLDKIDKFLMEREFMTLSGITESHIIVHICTNPNGSTLKMERIISLCVEIVRAIEDSVKIIVSIGKVVRGILNIYESYNTAVIGLQKVFYNDNQTVYYPNMDNLLDYTFDEDKLSQFCESLAREDKKQSIYLLKELTADIRQHASMPASYVKDIYFRLLLLIYKSAKDRRLNLSEMEVDTDILRESVYSLPTLSKIEELVMDKLESFFQSLVNRSKNSSIILDIFKYVKENYSNEKLSLNSIALHIHLSPAYICVLFKEETGKTVNQYIAEYRLEKAKELLLDSRFKIKEISRRVGYCDSNYFTKIFRKMTGLSPLEFREGRL